MANKSKTSSKVAEKDRRARVEAMRREVAARERRKSAIFVALAVIVGLGLVAAAAVPAYLNKRNDPANKSLSSFGVSMAAASCSAATNDPVTGTQDHVGPGTNTPNITKVDYKQVPPSSGKHFAIPVVGSRAFYTAKDRPAMENLVHNLEHGYTVLWYDSTVKGAELKDLKDLATSARTKKPVGPQKFIVSAWDDAYGRFPSGKHVALSHWGTKQGHRQLCGKVSGEAVQKFITSYPFSDSPEPAGQ
ncbi:MAG: DUF3105 domain-containing protein [Actinomycetes bacterium]